MGAGIRIHTSTATSARTFVHSLINQSLVPYLERSAAHWNETVAAPRRGITGRLFTASRKYFGVGGGSGSNSRANTPSPIFGGTSSITPPSVTYTHTAQEALLRRLADFALVLRDYKLALSVYQTAARAYSSDKAYRHLAAAQEMIAVCHALLGQWSEVDTAHEQALSTYLTKIRSPLGAARATITLATLCAPDQPSLAASIYLRMASIDVDASAPRVALFLEQAAQLYVDIGYLRKCLIHLVLAGNKYAKSSLRLHAIRCYQVAQQLLPPKWDTMFDHVHLALGRQYYHLGDYGQSVQEMLKLVHPNQSMVLEELVYLYSQYPMAGPGKELEWHALEEGVPKVEIKAVDPICVHEKATLVLHITNSLLIPLSVCSPNLVFSTVAAPISSSATTSPTSSPASPAAPDALPPVIDVEVPTTSHSIECEPTVTIQAFLTLHGLRPGSATMTHLTYRMFDMIPIRIPLVKPVTIHVIPPRARLSVQWELPSVVFASQVMRVPTLLTNTGFIDSGPIGIRVVDPPPPTASIGTHESVIITVDKSTPLPSSLAPGESAQVTLWTHWHASNAQVEWTYGQGAPGAKAHAHVDVHPIAVTMVPLVNAAHATWAPLSGSSRD
ncbi:ER-golgi trafficking TRAPP I complex 85 kDa subunit-domain-containing protein [Catenaria anguillulae PL171]|uniref:ER-golgi trafficking TRAPP I complex 85 kDa subunit-domain-containing protein n=1 Tax=Catenaria anguillulae PL171 TaxID=765915 RepID=A0A1Y2I3D5_9FUNG|nr:ER-golgi trafficking TRAPP I complex 85 kDa subunit-domain-containing protein [Catenaria anguillulae PL171]